MRILYQSTQASMPETFLTHFWSLPSLHCILHLAPTCHLSSKTCLSFLTTAHYQCPVQYWSWDFLPAQNICNYSCLAQTSLETITSLVDPFQATCAQQRVVANFLLTNTTRPLTFVYPTCLDITRHFRFSSVYTVFTQNFPYSLSSKSGHPYTTIPRQTLFVCSL